MSDSRGRIVFTFFVSALVAGAALQASASPVGQLIAFAPGQRIRAADFNDNFAALRNAIDDDTNQIATLGQSIRSIQLTPGPQGAQGPAGPQGIQGAAGPRGDTGAQGPAGGQGLQGIQGPAGPAGPQGAVGPAGSQGIQGPAGPVGPAGPQGDTGATGAQGAAGPQGATGPSGAGAVILRSRNGLYCSDGSSPGSSVATFNQNSGLGYIPVDPDEIAGKPYTLSATAQVFNYSTGTAVAPSTPGTVSLTVRWYFQPVTGTQVTVDEQTFVVTVSDANVIKLSITGTAPQIPSFANGVAAPRYLFAVLVVSSSTTTFGSSVELGGTARITLGTPPS